MKKNNKSFLEFTTFMIYLYKSIIEELKSKILWEKYIIKLKLTKWKKITNSVKIFEIFYGRFQLEPFHINLL